MRFKKGDFLTTKNWLFRKPVAQVTRVTREGVVHCVNLAACATMKEGDKFHFTPNENTRYELHSGG
jgi:hypothetical protein